MALCNVCRTQPCRCLFEQIYTEFSYFVWNEDKQEYTDPEVQAAWERYKASLEGK